MNVDKSEERIRRMFGEISPRYDFLNHLLSGGTDYYWRWRAVRAAKVPVGAALLDVCTGTGDLAIALWKRHRGKAEVVGTDFTHEMLEHANAKRDAKKIPSEEQDGVNLRPLTFLEADTQNLPFEDDRFDLVSVAFGLRNVTDTRKGLREMVRVCRPGGMVMVLEFSLPSNGLLRRLYLWYFRTILPKIGQFFARNKQAAYNYLPASVSEFPYGNDLAKVMEECGLETVRWNPMTLGIATLYRGVKPEMSRPAESCLTKSARDLAVEV